MFRSMTAYGQAQMTTEAGMFLIEIHSVNRKSLDITVNLPRELLIFDMDLRKALSKEVKRGCITIRITREDQRVSKGMTMPDIEAMKSMYSICQDYAKELGYDSKESIPFHVLLNYGFTLSETPNLCMNETFQNQLMEGFKKALSAFISMREKEGTSLLIDIAPRLDHIEKKLKTIINRVNKAPEQFEERLKKRLAELDLLKEADEDRMMREIVLFADKVNVTEEMTRLDSHVQQFRELLNSKKRRVGRELDFLLQEMNREVNTIAAKSQDLKITQIILEIKTEQEKIREQIQNIE